MDVLKGFATLALAVFLFAGMPLTAAAQGPDEENPPVIEGRVEEVGANGILVDGRYYYLDDAVIEDGQMNKVGRDALVVGTRVALFLEGEKVMLIIIMGTY